MEWTCVFSPNESFALEAGVRLRPVPELGVCLAYTQKRPAIHQLNPASWLIASICDGRELRDIAADYRASLCGYPDWENQLHDGIRQLMEIGVLKRVQVGMRRH